MSVVGDLIRKVEEELETYRVHDKHEARNIDASVPDHGMPHMDEENLAVPEVHTGKAGAVHEEQPEAEEAGRYGGVAVPEIHIPKRT